VGSGVPRPGSSRRPREKWTPSPAPWEPAEGRGEEPRFQATQRHPGSFDGSTVRAAGRKADLGARSTPEPLRAFGCFAVRQGCPPRSEQASRASCRSLVGSWRSAERELDSQPGNRCSAARGLRWPPSALDTPTGGVTRRSWACSDLTLVSRSRTNAFGLPEAFADRRRPRSWNAGTRSCGPVGSDPKKGVRGKSVRARSRRKMPTHRVAGDPKRVKRHEARHSPGSRAKARRARQAT
jgi:hypothetical protein